MFTPKSLLRAKESRSPIDELTHGSFQEVLDDPASPIRGAVQRVVFCSGKVALRRHRRARRSVGAPVAVVRVEQLYPFPHEQLARRAGAGTPNASELVWLQEEPENMGAVELRRRVGLYEALGDDYSIRRVSRFESGSPAAGSLAIHVQEQEQLVEDAVVTGV